MRRIGLLIILALAAGQAHATTLWTGSTVVVTASPECVTNASLNPPRVGQTYYTMVRPAGVSGNPSNTYLALYEEDRTVFGMVVDGPGVPFGDYAFDGIRIDGSRYGSFDNPQLGLLNSYAHQPSTITTTTKTITWQADVGGNFMGISGCAVLLRSSVAR